MRTTWMTAAALAFSAFVMTASPPALADGRAAGITTLSSRADTISGGNVLVRVDVPDPARKGRLTVLLNGHDVTAAFHADAAAAGGYTGLVDGLAVGANVMQAWAKSKADGQPDAQATLVNYPIEGPIFSGPRQSPFICQTQNFKLPDGTFLGAPTDATTCSAPTIIEYVYMSTAGGALKPMPNTASLPADVAMTTTDSGVTVPYVVRVETGTMDRGIYQNAVLHDPTREAAPTPFTPPKGWNRRLQGLHGVGCPNGWYIQGAAMGENILAQTDLLGRGFGMFINTLNHPTNSCNAFLAGEVTSMGKEHFIKTFGVPYYTVSRGCSGGSYSSEQVADAFPGLFDGILVDCTFPDPFAIVFSAQDGHLLTHFFYNYPGYSDAQKAAISGYSNPTTLLAAANQSQRTDPIAHVDPSAPGYTPGTFNAAVPVALRYDPVANPTGARPTVYDENANVFGKDPATGFALRTFDNVGVQYGLAALNAGVITPTQFLDLNQYVGGYDADEKYIPQRTVGDAGAIRRMHHSGLNMGGQGGLSSIPFVDFTGIYGETTTNYHLQWEHFAARERLKEANGNSDNHVMWRAIPATLPLDGPARALFDRWMEAYKADTSNRTQREKVIHDKPADAVDGCYTGASTATFVAEPQTFSHTSTSTCNTLMPSYAFPRYAAGGPLAADVLKCDLKPLAAGDYAVSFTAAEWARLQAIFPGGVCDWSKKGVQHVSVLPWAASPAVGVVNMTACRNVLAGSTNAELCLPPVEVSIQPQTVNLKSKGWVTATISAPSGESLRDWAISGVTLNGVAAASTSMLGDGRSVVARFATDQLGALQQGNAVVMSVSGTMSKGHDQGQFIAADLVTVSK
ncbi:MAG: hypothetical protein KGN16_11680 [Burkholderiales bacterium]|nr:hypothetical protein [Burkholderiales bacterium]